MKLLLPSSLFVALFVAGHLPQQASAAIETTVILSELFPDPGSSTGLDSQAEFTELFNPTTATVDITGYQLCDTNGCTTLSGSIASGGYFVICRNAGFISPCDDTTTIFLNNNGETVTLKDSSGTTLDTWSYSSSETDVSLERGSSDASSPNWAWRSSGFTPGSGPLTVADDDDDDGQNGGGFGDPHFETWGGQIYDYHGVCDLILVSVSKFGKGLGLDIHIRTKEKNGYSYIETAAIRIGDTIFQVQSFGDYMLNGVEGAELPAKIAEVYEVTHEMPNKKKNIFTIHIGKKEKIVVTTFKFMISVHIEGGSKETFGESVGLMGSYSDGGKLVGRDASSDFGEDYNAFGQEWQVLESEPKLFESLRAPQHPDEACIIPKPLVKTSRRLGETTIAVEEAAKACAHVDEEKKDLCMFDVVAMGDLEVAMAF